MHKRLARDHDHGERSKMLTIVWISPYAAYL